MILILDGKAFKYDPEVGFNKVHLGYGLDEMKQKPVEYNPWKELTDPCAPDLNDLENYLVCYQESAGCYSAPIRAYWVEEEGCFFPLDAQYAFPLNVDLYMRIPKPRFKNADY